MEERERQLSPAVARLALRLARPGRTASPAVFEWSEAAEHCRLAYVRGLFLATGSLSLAGGRTHLEFTVPLEDAAAFARRLGELGLPAAVRVRRGRGVVTWKGAEKVVTFLRRAGASAAVLDLESRLVTRALRAHLNRIVNAEAANAERSVAAASRQLALIDALDRAGTLAELPATVRNVAHARREAPEATFGELGARLGLSRSLVQRAFARIEALASGEPDGIRGETAARGLAAGATTTGGSLDVTR